MFKVKELKILREIANNSRISKKQLAKKVGISRELMEYHVKKLKQKKIILGSQARINLSSFSSNNYHLLIKLKNKSKVREDKLIETLKKLNYTHFIARIGGDFDYIVGFSIKKTDDLQVYIDTLYEKHGTIVEHHEIFTMIQEIKNDFSEVFEGGTFPKQKSIVNVEEKPILDKKDKIILQELSIDAQTPTIKIAEKCKLTPAAILQRIKKLMKEKIILSFMTRIDVMKLKKEFYYVFFSIDNPNQENLRKMEKQILSNKNLLFGSQLVGRHSFLSIFFADSNKELYEKISNFKTKTSEFKEQAIYLILDFIYENHLPKGFLEN